MKRGPKTGRAARRHRGETPPIGLGDCPAELTGLGRDLWLDAAAHLKAAGRDFKAFRTALRVACRLVDGMEPDAGITKADACRRWLAEMGLTPASAGKGNEHGSAAQEPAETGRAKVFRILEGKGRSA
jgi:hypothetical protein